MPCAEVSQSMFVHIARFFILFALLGPEHTATSGGSGQPSYCTLPMFHPPRDPNAAPAGLGYVSNDGHHFSCKNPVVMQQAFHV